MTAERSPSPESLIAALHEFEERVRSHHDALWEEEKHYTWFLSLFFPAIGVIFMATNVRPWVRLIVESILSSFGLVMSRNAISVIARESELMRESLLLGDGVASTLGLPWREPLQRPASRGLRELVRHTPAWLFPHMFKNAKSDKALGVRDAFRLTFELFSFIFIVAFVFLTAIAFPLGLYPT